MNTTVQHTPTSSQPLTTQEEIEQSLTVESITQGIYQNAGRVPVVGNILRNPVTKALEQPLQEATKEHRAQLNNATAEGRGWIAERVAPVIDGVMQFIGNTAQSLIGMLPEAVQVHAVNLLPLPDRIKTNLRAEFSPEGQEATQNAVTPSEQTTAQAPAVTAPAATQVNPEQQAVKPATRQNATQASEHEVPAGEQISPAPTPAVEQASQPEQGQIRG